MVQHKGSVFVDTNVILECFRIDKWRALVGSYQVETVEICLPEGN